jgi:hypothetical protein
MDKQDFKQQEQELRDILNKWDFLGVVEATKEGGFDEYDDLNHLILSALQKGVSKEEIRNLVKKELAEHYGLPVEPVGLESTLQKIFTWWKNPEDARLTKLKILQLPELKGTVYIGLNNKDIKPPKAWAPDSTYLDDEVFAVIFSPSFQSANKNYTLFGFTELDTQQLGVLKKSLTENGLILQGLKSYDEFNAYIGRDGVDYNMQEVLKDDFPDLEDAWKSIVEKFKIINNQVLSLVEDTLKSGNSLWVLGL